MKRIATSIALVAGAAALVIVGITIINIIIRNMEILGIITLALFCVAGLVVVLGALSVSGTRWHHCRKCRTFVSEDGDRVLDTPRTGHIVWDTICTRCDH